MTDKMYDKMKDRRDYYKGVIDQPYDNTISDYARGYHNAMCDFIEMGSEDRKSTKEDVELCKGSIICALRCSCGRVYTLKPDFNGVFTSKCGKNYLITGKCITNEDAIDAANELSWRRENE